MNVKRILHISDSITEWIGKLASWLILILIFTLVYEVIARQLFNSPTTWSYDLSYMLGGSAAFIGIAWVQKTHRHIRVDVLFEKWSNKNKIIIDLLFTLVLFLPLMFVGFLNSLEFAIQSWTRLESVSSVWGPPLYPLKSIIPLTLFLLLLQGITDVIKLVLSLRKGEY